MGKTLKLCHTSGMAKTIHWSKSVWKTVLYSVLLGAIINVIFQFILTWRQFDALVHARPILVVAAVLNQIVAYGVVVPAMGRFYERCAIQLTQWRVFALVSAGLASSRVIPAGEFLVWRMSLRRHHGAKGATTQWFILYTIAVNGALALLFLIFEGLSLAMYPQAQAVTIFDHLRYIPIGVGVTVVLLLLALRIPAFRRWVWHHAFGEVTQQRSLSPMGIIRERRLDWTDAGWNAFAAFGAWLVEGYTLYLCFAAIGIHVPFVLSIAGYCFARLIANLPLSPGGIGEMEASAALFFATYGFPIGPVVTATFLHRLITYWPPIIIGVLFYSLAGRHGERERIDLGLQPFAKDVHDRSAQHS